MSSCKSNLIFKQQDYKGLASKLPRCALIQSVMQTATAEANWDKLREKERFTDGQILNETKFSSKRGHNVTWLKNVKDI